MHPSMYLASSFTYWLASLFQMLLSLSSGSAARIYVLRVSSIDLWLTYFECEEQLQSN
jgi:hypothetical protein